jgi:hypothetical protein
MAAVKSEVELNKLFSELEPVELAPGTHWLATVFTQLNNRRSQGMGGPLRISFPEIIAFKNLMDLDLTPWEVETLCQMDEAWIEETYKLKDNG